MILRYFMYTKTPNGKVETEVRSPLLLLYATQFGTLALDPIDKLRCMFTIS